MTQKEINELKARVYSVSNCMFPLDTFFNNIRDNKESTFDKNRAYNDLKLITDAIYELKDELKKREKEQKQDYTLQECKKMWEEAGYIIDILSFPIYISFESDGWVEEITIYEDKEYDSSRGYFTFQEHQLITKTIKALEKEKENHNETI